MPEDKKGETDKIQLQYALSGAPNSWKQYTGQLTIEENMVVYARLSYLNETTEIPASLTIGNIDKLPPKAFTPSITKTTNQITVTANTTDAEATNQYACSGLAGYSFSKDGGKTWTAYQTSGTHQFTDLTQNTTYKIQVKAKDAAGNETRGNINVTTEGVPTPTEVDLKYTITWNGINATVTFTTTSGYAIQTYANEAPDWLNSNPITVRTGTTIYVRYWDSASPDYNMGERYAAVTPILKYNVVWRANGGTGNSTYDAERNYGTTYQTKPANTFSRPGYTLTGWKCSSNNLIYGTSADYSNLTTDNGRDVYMDAQWKDVEVPATPRITNPSGGNWTNQNVILTVSSSDTGSGINRLEYSYDKNTWRTDWGYNYTTSGTTKSIQGSWNACLLYTSPSPRDPKTSRMPSSA